METIHTQAASAAAFIKSQVPPTLQRPHIAIICGSGLSGLQDTLAPSPRFSLPYAEIPNFPTPTVAGHAGTLVFGLIETWKGVTAPVMLLVGRAHYYEGHSMPLVTFATRVVSHLRISTLVLTNAAGGLNPAYVPGDIVLLSDHLNLPGLTGSNPLIGPNDASVGPRFPPLSDAYDLDLRRSAHEAWGEIAAMSDKSETTRRLHEGVYVFASGPFYETRAEARMLRMFGADVVGMSTVPEVLVARHAGVRVLALSLVTNSVVLEPPIRGDAEHLRGKSAAELQELLSRGRANHEEVLAAGKEAALAMQELVKRICQRLIADVTQ